MKIALIHPRIVAPLPGPLPAAVGDRSEIMPPLGLLYLAGYLRDRSSHDAAVIDALAEQLDDDKLAARLRLLSPAIVGITAMSHTLRDALAAVRTVKRTLPGVPVVMGGPHPTLFPRETLALPGIDLIIAGEGELPLKLLLDALETGDALDTVPGLGRKSGGAMVLNETLWYADRLDDLPPPARELIPPELYGSALSTHRPLTSMLTSRGCPYHCSFCDRPLLKGNRWRAHTAAAVVGEMERCAAQGFREVVVYDDTFTVDRQRVLDICALKMTRLPDLPFTIRTRPDLVDGELLKALAAARCTAVHYGVESGSPRVLARLSKDADIGKAVAACAATRRLGMTTLAYFMIGSPGETRDDIAETFRLIDRIDPDYLHLTVLMPFPGTAVYREMLDNGLLKEDVWRSFAADPERQFEPPLWEGTFSRDELLTLLRRGYRRFYGRPGYILRQLGHISSPRELFVKIQKGLRVLTMR